MVEGGEGVTTARAQADLERSEAMPSRRYMIPRPQCGRARRVRNPARRSWVRSAGFSVTGFSSRMILHSSQVKTLDSPQIDAAPASYCCGQTSSDLICECPHAAGQPSTSDSSVVSKGADDQHRHVDQSIVSVVLLLGDSCLPCIMTR
ncbi:hypothetical protein RRG08_004683 [Elysia crispata]|uniref:Uncharacterized protein n=1 Tax=Elysia crispata TaxID=231223 RepID=A0AAE1DW28_9GAST|nr:hypothetical protein RRG08_004683 [Elysia crispata]